MTPIEHIRRDRLKVTQVVLAAIAGTTQGNVSRWERKAGVPDLDQAGKIRAYAIRKGLPWQDAWFFEAPKANGRHR